VGFERFGPANGRVGAEMIRDEHRRAGAANAADLPDVERHASEAARQPPPVLTGDLDRPPRARQEMQATGLVWTLGSRGAGGRADVTRSDQPDPGERDVRFAEQPVDDALKHEL